MMLFINYIGWAKIKFRKWADYDCRKQGFLFTINCRQFSQYLRDAVPNRKE